MGPLEQTNETWSPLQFPSAPLSALTIPHVNAAVQSGVAGLFMRDYGYLVDHKGHSAFCLDAFQGGLIHESDLRPLVDYPNGYGLHLVTGKVVRSIESRLEFTVDTALPDAARLSGELARGYYDIAYASGIALAAAEAGLLHDTVLSPLISRGDDCGFELVNAVKDAVNNLWPIVNREQRNVDEGTVYTSLPFYTEIQGTDFVLEANERNTFYLDWPAPSQEFLEMHILLCKTLDAMSTYLVPFQTPASAFGYWGQFSYGVSESYEAVKDAITGNSKADIVEYLLEYGDTDELGWLGMMLAEEDELDPESVDHAAELLWQIDDVNRNFSYRLTYGEGADDQTRKAEMGQLLSQARESIAHGKEHSKLAQVLCDALEACIARADTHRDVESMTRGDVPLHEDLYQFENSPNRFYDCIWVLADLRHEALHNDAMDSFNANAEECAGFAVRLPLKSSELVAQVTIPIMERTNQCLALLRRIQLSLEVSPDA